MFLLFSPVNAEKFLAVLFWGIAGVFLKGLYEMTFRAESEIIRYLYISIFGKFQQIFRRLGPLLRDVLRDSHAHFTVEQL